MSVYGLLVQKRRDERAKRERGLSPRALSRLTRTVDDRRAWDDAYCSAVRIEAARNARCADEWSCEHGYFEGHGCPDCDVPSYWPTAFNVMEREG